MKIYLASFLEPENFGPGRVIGIVNGEKPKYVRCDTKFDPLTPKQTLTDTYNDMAANDPLNASEAFVNGFTAQLDEFCEDVAKSAKEKDQSPTDILPFKDGDTLASWERGDYTNYRVLVAPFLKKLGYDVVVN